jgi:hypothetical protein
LQSVGNVARAPGRGVTDAFCPSTGAIAPRQSAAITVVAAADMRMEFTNDGQAEYTHDAMPRLGWLEMSEQ